MGREAEFPGALFHDLSRRLVELADRRGDPAPFACDPVGGVLLALVEVTQGDPGSPQQQADALGVDAHEPTLPSAEVERRDDPATDQERQGERMPPIECGGVTMGEDPADVAGAVAQAEHGVFGAGDRAREFDRPVQDRLAIALGGEVGDRERQQGGLATLATGPDLGVIGLQTHVGTVATPSNALHAGDSRSPRLTLRLDPPSPTYRGGMCRNIRPLHNFEPPATDDEVRAAALQFVRKVSGTTRPSQANQAVFDRAVAEVAHATRQLLDDLVTAAPRKDRAEEAAKARARAEARYAR